MESTHVVSNAVVDSRGSRLTTALLAAVIAMLVSPMAQARHGQQRAQANHRQTRHHLVRVSSARPPKPGTHHSPVGAPLQVNLWDVEDRFTANGLTAQQYLGRRVRTRLIFVEAGRYQKWPRLAGIAVRNLFGIPLFAKKIVVVILPNAMTPAQGMIATQALENGDEIEVTGTLMARRTREQTGVDQAGDYVGTFTEQQPIYIIMQASFRRTRTGAQIAAAEAPAPQPEALGDQDQTPPDQAPQETLMDIMRENEQKYGSGPGYYNPYFDGH